MLLSWRYCKADRLVFNLFGSTFSLTRRFLECTLLPLWWVLAGKRQNVQAEHWLARQLCDAKLAIIVDELLDCCGRHCGHASCPMNSQTTRRYRGWSLLAKMAKLVVLFRFSVLCCWYPSQDFSTPVALPKTDVLVYWPDYDGAAYLFVILLMHSERLDAVMARDDIFF